MEQMDIRYTYSWMGDLQSYPGGHGWSKPSFSKKNGNVDQYINIQNIIPLLYIYICICICLYSHYSPKNTFIISPIEKKKKKTGLSLDVEDDILS